MQRAIPNTHVLFATLECVLHLVSRGFTPLKTITMMTKTVVILCALTLNLKAVLNSSSFNTVLNTVFFAINHFFDSSALDTIAACLYLNEMSAFLLFLTPILYYLILLGLKAR